MSSRKRSLSCVLLALLVAPTLQGCRGMGAYPPIQTIQTVPRNPRGLARLTSEEELLIEEACCALDAGEPAALSSKFPSSRAAILLDAILERQAARKSSELQARQLPALQSEPASSPVRDEAGARRAFQEARVFLEKGKMEEACDRLEDAVALDPGNAEYEAALASACKQLGLEHYGRRDLRRASLYWKRTLEIRPDDEEAQRFLRRASRVIENR